MLADVVRRPAGAKLRAAGRQLTDKIAECAVIGVTTSAGVQDGYGLIGCAVPVEMERTGPVVEKDEPGVVSRTCRAEIHIGVQGVAELIGGEDVEASVAYKCRGTGDRVQRQKHARANVLLRSRVTSRRPTALTGSAGQVKEMRAFRIVELQRPSKALQDAL